MKIIKVEIFNINGQEGFRAISLHCWKSNQGFILVYDITNRRSSESLFKILKKKLILIGLIFLVANKVELFDEEVVSSEKRQNLANELKIIFYESSAKKRILCK